MTDDVPLPLDEPPPPDRAAPEQWQALRERMEELKEQARLAKVAERQAERGSVPPAPPPSLGERLQVVEDRLKSVEAVLAGAVDMADRLARTEDRVEEHHGWLLKLREWLKERIKNQNKPAPPAKPRSR